MTTIRFTAVPYTIGSMTIVRLPKDASSKFPSRGMAMATGTMNGSPVTLPLEPDGKGSHWFALSKKTNKPVMLDIEPLKEWPDPAVPADWKKALAAHPAQQKLWEDITPMARWDWIRWIGMSKNPDTRKKHIDVALSKMKGGERRPCCFNRSMCTEPTVSKTGVLLGPE